MKGNKRWVCMCINSIRKKIWKVNPLLGQAGDLLTRDKEKAVLLQYKNRNMSLHKANVAQIGKQLLWFVFFSEIFYVSH